MVLQKNFNIIYLDVKVIKVFMASPFAAFISSQNLRSFLVWSKVYPLKKAVGLSKCGSKSRHAIGTRKKNLKSGNN